MSVLRPEPMLKFGLVGLKEDRERLLGALHDLNIVQLEPLGKDALEHIDAERGSPDSRRVSDELLRFRALKSSLPAVPGGGPRAFGSLPEIFEAAATVTMDEEVSGLKREEDALVTERKSIEDDRELLARFSFYTEPLEYLQSKSVLAFFGETDAKSFDQFVPAIPNLRDSHLTRRQDGKIVQFLLVIRSTDAEAVNRLTRQKGVTLTAVPRLSGTPQQATEQLLKRRDEIDRRLAEIQARLTELAKSWFPTVATVEEALAIESKKLDHFARLGSSARAFALEGWVPKRRWSLLTKLVGDVAQDRAVLYTIPTTEEPPTLMANPTGVRRFEFFIRFYSLPQATEWDPTVVFAVVFPILFGLMLGDWGYGLTILLVSLWMIAGFPGRERLPKSIKGFVKNIVGPEGMRSLAYALLPGCLIAMGLGFYFDEFFGFRLLHSLVGYNGPDPASGQNVARLLVIAGYIGLAMVLFGFLLGLLKEYFHHHVRGALGKVGGILFALGIATFGLQFIHRTYGTIFYTGIGVTVVGALLFVFAEGIQRALIESLEIVSHILSYTRLVGILLASVILALVINTVSFGLFAGGGPPLQRFGLFVGGLVILVMGQAFNVILGVFEPGIQGARLIFVEYFSKFYSGNGRPFRPFGSSRKYTLPTYTPPTGASPATTPN